MRRLIAGAMCLALSLGCADKGPKPDAAADDKGTTSTGDAQLDAAQKAVDFLLSRQNADGGFGSFKGQPASSTGVTGLVAVALMESPAGITESSNPKLASALKYIVDNQQDNGALAVAGQGLENYHTCLSVIALKRTGNPAYASALEKAKAFLKGLQLDEGEGLDKSNPFFGGAGYSPNAKVSDLSNTAFWIEAMKELGVDSDDPAMKNAMVFVSRVTNNSEVNDQEWARGVAPEDAGGAVYRPAPDPNRDNVDISKAGKSKTGWRSYGSMTYSMFKSFIYSGAKRDDPAVKGALDWIEKNYTLDENPGIGAEGQYYYYRMFAKALTAWGEDKVGGHEWAKDLADKLVELQSADGSWINTADRWHEGDPTLVTAYSLESLSIALRELGKVK